jgi:hypothetical protein
MAFWPAIEKEVKRREVMDKIAPELGINRGGWPKEI